MLTCPRCGQENPDGARFCNACAAPLAADRRRRGSRSARSSPSSSPTSSASRHARSRWIPRRCASLLRPYHARLRDELERFGGTVEKFIGDAVMAVFGAPVAHEDDAERAVRAALAIRDWILDEQAELQLRIGVNTGQALVSLGARPEEGEGMVAGDVVNTAARLQSNAPVNGILVGETTWRATRDAIDYRPAEPVQAKGKAEPVEAWEALEARGRVGVDISTRVRTPLVGRRRELDSLLDAFERALSARSVQLVTLVGEPGIGKSRLVYELFRGGRARPGARLLASGPLAALRRRRQLLGARRDGQGAHGHPRDRRRGGGRPKTPCDRHGDRAGRRRRVDDRAPPPVGGHRGHGRPERQPGRGVRRLAGLPRGHRRPAPARPRLRGSPLGGRRPARLRRPPRRLGDARAAARRRHGPPGAARAALRLGRRQDECADALARAALRRRDRGARACAPRARRDSRGRPGDAARAGRRQPAVRGGVRAPARRARRTARRSRRRCRASSRPASTCSTARRRSCSRTLPCSAACSGSGARHGARGGRGSAPSTRATRVRPARAAEHGRRRDGVRVPARARSRGRVRADPARPAGREAPPRRRLARDARPLRGSSPSCSRITTSRCSTTRSPTASSPHGLPARWARRAIGRWRSTRTPAAAGFYRRALDLGRRRGARASSSSASAARSRRSPTPRLSDRPRRSVGRCS